jgi:hypothetical protein
MLDATHDVSEMLDHRFRRAIRKISRVTLRTLAESIGATYSSAILAFFVSIGIILFTGDHHWINGILASPTFLLPIITAVLLSYVLRNHLSRTSYFAWIVPGALFVRAALEVVRSPSATGSNTWNTLVGADCTASECLYEMLFTMPLVCALTYSVSSACIRAAERRGVTAREK